MLSNEKNKKFLRWPAYRAGEYLYFHLYKRNCDTMTAINQLSRFIHINPKNFSYSGTKDRRAITCQAVTVKKVEATRLYNAVNNLKKNKSGHIFSVGNFKYVKEPLRLGSLYGNHFTIILRNINVDFSSCLDGLNSVQKWFYKLWYTKIWYKIYTYT